MEGSTVHECVRTIKTEWDRVKVEEHLHPCGLVLTDVDDGVSSGFESLAICFIQHLCGRYTAISLKEALGPGSNFISNNSEQRWILFCVRLEQIRRQLPAGQIIAIVKLMEEFQWFQLEFQPFQLVSIRSQGIAKNIISRQTNEKVALKAARICYVWQDPKTQLFNCIVRQRDIYSPNPQFCWNFYWETLLLDVQKNFRDFFYRQMKKNYENDNEISKKIEDYITDLAKCGPSIQDFQEMFDRWEVDGGFKESLIEDMTPYFEKHEEKIVSYNVTSELKQELIESLGNASKDFFAQQDGDYIKTKYTTIDNKESTERENRRLELSLKEDEKELARLEKRLKRITEVKQQEEKAVQESRSQLKLNKEKQQHMKQLRNDEIAEIQEDVQVCLDKQIELKKNIQQKNAEAKRAQKTLNLAEKQVETTKEQLKFKRQDGQNMNVRLALENESMADLEIQKEHINKATSSLKRQKEETEQLVMISQQKLTREEIQFRQLKNNYEKQRNQLAWNMFLSKLNNSFPPYELAKKRGNHQIFQITCPVEMFKNTVYLFELALDQENQTNVISHLKTANSQDAIKEIHRILNGMVSKPKYQISGCPWKVFGSDALVLSDINLNEINQEIHLYADRVIYVDRDWTIPGVSIAFSAPVIQVVGSNKRTIDTSGRNAPQFTTKKAQNGNGVGVSGDHGEHGKPGQSAGHVTIKCDSLTGNLVVKARGGDGADGQDGGDGQAGIDGKDGKDGQLPSNMEKFSGYPYPFAGAIPGYNVVAVFRAFNNRASKKPREYSDYGKKGTAGKQGGCGGNSGCGGQGGLQGKVDVQCPNIKRSIDTSNISNGSDGHDGQPGMGADGGAGGKHGTDVACVFEPDDLKPYIEVTGNWVTKRGDLDIIPIYDRIFTKGILGYHIDKNADDKGRAINGQRGQNGKKGDQRQKKTAIPQKIMSSVAKDHWKKSSTTSSVDRAFLDRNLQLKSNLVQTDTDAVRAKNRNLAMISERKKEQEAINHQIDRSRQNLKRMEEDMQQAKGKIDQLTHEIKLNEEEQRETEKRLSVENKKCKESKLKVLNIEESLKSLKLKYREVVGEKNKLEADIVKINQKMIDEQTELTQKTQLLREELKWHTKEHDDARREEKEFKLKLTNKSKEMEKNETRINQNKKNMIESHETMLELQEKRNLFTQKSHQVTEKLNQTRQELDATRKLSAINKRSNQQIQRISDNASNQFYEDDQFDIITSFVYNSRPIPSNLNSLSGIQLLDALIIKFSDNVENMLTLSLLSQSLLLQVKHPNMWESVTAIVRNHMEDPSTLTECLKQINEDIEIAQLIDSNKETTVLAQIQGTLKNKNSTQFQNIDVLEILYQLRTTKWSYAEVQNIFQQLKNPKTEEKSSEIGMSQVESVLGNHLISLVTKHLKNCYPADYYPVDCQTLLTRLLQQSLKINPSLSIATFFDGLLKKTRKISSKELENNNLLEQTLSEFIDSLKLPENESTNVTGPPGAKNQLSDYFNYWIKCLKEIEKISETTQKKWKKYLDVEDPTNTNSKKSNLRIQILISKYDLITNWFLSPVESLAKWKSLADINPDKLQEEIIDRMNCYDNFPLIKTLMSSVDDNIAQLVKGTNLKDTGNKTTKNGDARATISGLSKLNKWFFITFDYFITLLKSEEISLSGDEITTRLSKLMDDMELLVEILLIGWEGKKSTDLEANLQQRENMLENCWNLSSSPGVIPVEIYERLFKMLDFVRQMAFMNVQDETLISTINNQIQEKRKQIQNEIEFVSSFVGHLLEFSPKDRTKSIGRTTKEILGEGQDINFYNIARCNNILKEKIIAIWKKCVPEFHPKEDKIESFVETLLNPSDNLLKLRLAIAANMLLVNGIFDKHDLENWVNMLTTIINNRSSDNNDDQLKNFQVALKVRLEIIQLESFGDEDKIQLFNYNDTLDRLKDVARYLGRCDVEVNQLFLQGLVRLGNCNNQPVPDFISTYIKQLNIHNEKKMDILGVVYPLIRTKQFKVSLNYTELAFVERWIQSEACYTKANKIQALLVRLEKVAPEQPNLILKKINNRNRLWDVCDALDILTDEEKKYVYLVDKVELEEIIKSRPPASYLYELKERAVNSVYLSFINCYSSPSTSDSALQQLFEKYQSIQLDETTMKSLTQEQRVVFDFNKSFNRAYFFAKRDQVELEWLLWYRVTVVKSIESCADNDGISMETIGDLLSFVTELPIEQLFQTTMTSRPHHWIDNLLVSSITSTLDRIEKQQQNDNKSTETKNSELVFELHNFLRSTTNGREILKILLRKLKKEAELSVAFEAIDRNLLIQIVSQLRNLQKIESIELFRDSTVGQWPRVIRLQKLTEEWNPKLANQLISWVDRCFNQNTTDKFLIRFRHKFTDGKPDILSLEKILANLRKNPWVAQKLSDLANMTDEHYEIEAERIWQILLDENLIKAELAKMSKTDLTVDEILRIMNLDPECKSIIEDQQKQENLIRQINAVKSRINRRRESKPTGEWTEKEIREWSETVKERIALHKEKLNSIEFLAVASRAVMLEKGFLPRDAQLLAVLIFISSSSTTSSSCNRWMAQISTGEGKTLISAMLAVYHALSNWSGRRHVNILTSSSVLAEGNVREIEWFYQQFGVTVTNNCDAACSEDDDKRRQRYNFDVIYGDLSNFQRDILLTKFYERDITRGREAGAVIVDEVDSMLLDKGENILYLSHSIPEMDQLFQIFIEIWNAVHAPDVLLGQEEDVEKICDFIQLRMKEEEILVPKCLSSFVDRHLSSWINSAFRAKYLVMSKDAYKVDDVGDGRGQQIVIMDKETGVEQVQMQWTHGLHQSVQLKHTLKLSSVSLKAVFMSNIGFFDQCRDVSLYGLTGTLGSVAECDLLHNVFNVEFFKMPRFRQRFCHEEEPLLASNKEEWLQNVVSATRAQLKGDKPRAVLVVSENIADAEDIHKSLGELAKEEVNINLKSYVSSFDKEFQKNQHETALSPGDVIVATNLAGRGTDFKIDDSLAANGGLHVIISFVPPNSRVEAQAEGRTARAGQLGSFQFSVMTDNKTVESDPVLGLQRLKTERDRQESLRLDNIRTKGLQRIFLEEKLFDRFQKEIYSKGKSMEDRWDIKLQLKFLTNHWALWLDQNANLIEKAHLGKQVKVAEAKFEEFKEYCLQLIGGQHFDIFMFASTPTELLVLGHFYTELWTANKKESDRSNAIKCYERIIKEDPNFCEAAAIYQTRLLLQNAGVREKEIVKPLLIKAKTLIKKKMELFTSANEVIKNTAEIHRRAGGSYCSQNRFEEQVTNKLSLLQIHLSSIEDILGRPMRRAIQMQYSNEEEARELIDVLLDLSESSLCHPFKLANNLMVDDQQELLIKQEDGKEKPVTWPSSLFYTRSPTIEYINNQIINGTFRVKETDFKHMVISQDELWKILIKENIVSNEKVINKQIIQIKKIDETENLTKGLPRELLDYMLVLLDWLKENNGKEFLIAVTSPGLKSKISTLEKFLRDKGMLIQVTQHYGLLSEKFELQKEEGARTSGQDLFKSLPEAVKKYSHLIEAWLRTEKTQMDDKDYVSRETLPCPKESAGSLRQLWDHLLDQGVIEDRVVVFSDQDGKDDDSVQRRVEKMKNELEYINKIEDICFKYHEPESVKEVTFSDAASYITNNKLDFVFNILKPIPDSLKEKITQQKRKEQLENYRSQLAQALTSSIGKLKTIPSITASLRPLSEYLPSDRSYPIDEIQEMENQLFDQVIVLKAAEKPWRWDWRAFAVAMIGVAQIVAGVALNVVTAGAASPIANALIAEGISDMVFAIQHGISGTFTWKGYASHKVWSVCLTVATAGIGAYLTRGAMAGRAALYGYRGKAGLSLLLSAGKKILAKCGQAILSAFSALGVDTFLTELKNLILENVLRHITVLISAIFSKPFQTLAKTLDSIWKEMKKNGRSLADTTKLIDDSMSKASQSELCTTWVNQITNKASSVGNAMCKAFSDASGVISAQGSHLQTEGKHQLFELEQTEGLNTLKGAHKTFNIAAKIASYTAKATKVIGVLKNGAEIINLVGYAPEYVANIDKSLSKEITKLEDMPSENQQQNSITKSDNDQFEKYKAEMCKRVEDDVANHMVNSVKSAWVQPWLQNKVESMATSLSKKAIEKVSEMFEQKGGQSSLVNGAQCTKNNKSKENAETAAAKKLLQEQVGEGVCQVERDQNGNNVLQAQKFEKVIENLGNGKAGLLEMQIVADALGLSLEIQDTVGDYTKGSNEKSFTYNPNGKNPTGGIKLIYTKNADGSRHLDLAGPDGKPVPLAPSADGTNHRCLYEAVAASQGCTVDNLLNNVKDHALNNKLARYLFDQNVQEALTDLKVGQRARSPGDNPVKINKKEGDHNGYRSVTVSTTIDEKNLKQGSEVLPKAREKMKENHPIDENVSASYDAGHLIAAQLGGRGDDFENLMPMHKYLNRGDFKNIESDICKFIQENKGVKVHVEVVAKLDSKRSPIEFKYNWRTDDRETEFRSGKLSNIDCLSANDRLRNPESVDSAMDRGVRCRGDFFTKGIPMNKPESAKDAFRLRNFQIAKKCESVEESRNSQNQSKATQSGQPKPWLADDSARTKRAKQQQNGS